MRPIAILISMGLLAAASTPTAARTWYVPDDAPTIQAGIDSCMSGDTVLVTCGTYYEHDIIMKSGVCLRSESGGPDCATIDAQHLGRVIKCVGVDSTTSIEGLTLTHGLAGRGPGSLGSGGGIYCQDASLLIANCRMVENSTTGWWGKGGGLRCDFCRATVRDCVFERNYSTYGGGVYCAHYAPTFTSCRFVDNTVDHEGGGLFLFICPAPITDCHFVGNTAARGGALTCRWMTSPEITEGLFVGNSADEGGALLLESLCSPTIERCTFVENSATDGATMFLVDTSEPIFNSSIVAFGFGGDPVGGDGACPTFHCSDIYGNAGGDWVGCIQDQLGMSGNFSADPLFCDTAAGNFTLRSDSPCLPGHHPDGWSCGIIGAYAAGCPITDVGWEELHRVDSFLETGTPNPFDASTCIQYGVRAPSWAHLRLQIYDSAGRLIRTLVDATRPPGNYAITWEGRNDRGDGVANGTYFYRLYVNGDVLTKRLVRIH